MQNRRGFMTTAAGLTAASLTLPHGTRAFAENGPGAPSVAYDTGYVPVLYESDVIILGGSFAAVSAAIACAGQGRRTVLVESRAYPGREMTATLRPWITVEKPDSLPATVAAVLEREDITPRNGTIPLRIDGVKLSLEDQLMDAGVRIVYVSSVIDVIRSGDEVTGVVIGNKSGRQVITGTAVIDATPTALAARIAGCSFKESANSRHVMRRTLEFTGVGSLTGDELAVPAELGIAGSRINLRRGYLGDGHVLVELGFDDLPAGYTDDDSRKRESEARHRSIRLVSHLVSTEPAFRNAFFAASSPELHCPGCAMLADNPPPSAHTGKSISCTVVHPAKGSTTIPLDRFATHVPGLWCLQESVRIEDSWQTWFSDPVSSSLLGKAFASALLKTIPPRDHTTMTESPRTSDHTRRYSHDMRISEPGSPEDGVRYPQYAVDRLSIPVMTTVDVLVVGGGTSGATAAIIAASEGVSAHVVDFNPVLGGTGTIGGVDSYWFGRIGGFNRRISRAVDDIHGMIGYDGRKWNIEAKMYALLRETERAGAGITLNAPVIGVVMESSTVKGAVFATQWGPRAILAGVTIDATGDGDVAVFAGAENTYGAESTHIPMWYSLAQFAEPGKTQNNFTGPVAIGNIEDYTRAILAGRRRGGTLHDHGAYLASRETRHIIANHQLTLTDILRERRWPDVVNIVFSNYDIKGMVDTDWLRMGYLPPNLEIEIPYRILLPKGIEGLLVAGKAISATHDALPPIRMQADLENLGGVVAVAAAQAVGSGRTPRMIDIARLQSRLVEYAILPPGIQGRKIDPREYSPRDLAGLMDRILKDRPFHLSGEMEMDDVVREPLPVVEFLTSGTATLDILEKEYGRTDGDTRLRIAQMLAWHGSKAGVPALIDRIMETFRGGALPPRKSNIRYTQLPPDHGAMPVVVYLMYSLGMAADMRSIPVWERVAELIDPSEEQFRDLMASTFDYVEAVCYGTEILGAREAIPALRRLHAFPTLHGLVVTDRIEPDFVQERRALLELGLGRALARCGDPGGLAILAGFLDDSRRALAGYAHCQLTSIIDVGLGKSRAAWEGWLDRNSSAWEPRPLLARRDT